MEKMKFKDVMKKCFGKEKNDRWHAVAMLILYGIFFLVAYIVLTFGGSGVDRNELKPTPTPTPVEKKENYTYNYILKTESTMEEVSGKKIDTKEKLIYTDYINGYKSYLIMNGTIYMLENDNQVKVDKISDNYKYFAKDKILELVKDMEPIVTGNTYAYDVSNTKLASIFGDTVTSDNTSQIFIVKENNNVTSITLELDSYIKDVTSEEHNLKVEMVYSSIGPTTDFEIVID